MSYPELSKEEIDDVVSFIKEQTEELEEIESNLNNLTRNFPRLTVDVLEAQPPDVRAGIMNVKASLLSSVTTVLSWVSGVIQKFRSAPSSVLSALLDFLNIFWRIISKYTGIFKIESITVTISVTPSVVVVLKP
jgi:Ni,Fe-hydrogenase III large subunit